MLAPTGHIYKNHLILQLIRDLRDADIVNAMLDVAGFVDPPLRDCCLDLNLFLLHLDMEDTFLR